jgi:mannose-1-phosphate guanylyltransferase/mannose-1-phosphate guanylyltransferase/mannose-6-phosphate isomerase
MVVAHGYHDHRAHDPQGIPVGQWVLNPPKIKSIKIKSIPRDDMMMQPRGRIIPVLLSGGTGSRLWPLSRETYPKQLLSLLDEKTLLQQTALRVADTSLFADPMVIANAEHRFAIGEQLRAVGISNPAIVLEPFGRNTAPAVAIAALLASESDPDAVILAMPVDHWVRDHAAFRAAVSSGLKAARHGRFVLFGLRPTAPATRFGYIRMGDGSAAAPDVRDVAGFVEKPDLAMVERFLAAQGRRREMGCVYREPYPGLSSDRIG